MRLLTRVSLALLLATATLAQDEYGGEDYDYKDYNGGDGQTGGGQKPPAPAPPAPVAPVVTTTVNPDNQRCPQNSGVNDRIRNAALEGHNYRRSRLAQGLVTNKKGKNLPRARNMLKLEYDCALETSAKKAVDRCSTSPSSLSSGVQENIYSLRQGSVSSRVNAMKEAMKYWWSQLKVVGTVGAQVTFRSAQLSSPISYFTRMAWATTAKIGCAVSQTNKCSNSYYIACHYQTGGNVPNAQIYTPGNRACNQCPGGYRCDSNQLCVRS